MFYEYEDDSGSLDINQWRAGWPLHSLVGTLVERGDAAGTSILVARHTLWPIAQRGIPYGPIWPGFAINTLFYAAVLWLLIPGPFVLRRFVRVRRGLCPKCAYPMGESAVCTECGKALSSMSKPSAIQ